MIAEEVKTKINSYLSFRLDEEVYSINAGNVLHILEMVKITKVPKSPEYMLGVINLRGTVLPVIDTRTKFAMPQMENTQNTCILVLEVNSNKEKIQVGAVVDEVQEVLEINEPEIKDPPSIGNKYKADFIDGVALINDDFIMILNIEKILSMEEIADRLKEIEPDLIGIEIPFSTQAKVAVECARAAKKVLPDTPVVMGGNHVTVLTEETAREEYVDYVNYDRQSPRQNAADKNSIQKCHPYLLRIVRYFASACA